MSTAGPRDGEMSEAAQPRRASRLRTVVGGLVVAAAIAGAVVAVYRERRDFFEAIKQMGAAAVVASFLFALLGVGLTVPVWREVLGSLGVRLPWRVATEVFFTSQLGKYLPGSVWPILLQIRAVRSRGRSPRTAIAANLLAIVLSCMVGLLLAAVLLPFLSAEALRRYGWVLLALPVLIALLHPRAIPSLLDGVARLLGRESLGERLGIRETLASCAWSAGSFAFLGLHIAALALATGSRFGVHLLLLCIGGMALAVCVGVLFVPAPAGAGIRDVVLGLILVGPLASAQAVTVVVISRAMLILVDLLLAAGAVAGRRCAFPEGSDSSGSSR